MMAKQVFLDRFVMQPTDLELDRNQATDLNDLDKKRLRIVAAADSSDPFDRTPLGDSVEERGRTSSYHLDLAAIDVTPVAVDGKNLAFFDCLGTKGPLAAGRVDGKPLATDDADRSELPGDYGGYGKDRQADVGERNRLTFDNEAPFRKIMVE